MIYFRRVSGQMWETAKNEKELNSKLVDDIAEVIMPAKPVWVRLWRKLFPMKFIEVKMEELEGKR